ncbi:hypothetical protein [Labrys monachus]|uniref:Uncharacterized protein n=1 Tax=Labrys monachus TaxID=217067 RepID=A0ABU0FIW6_9HYPH|nr:hypothetical protein [Labrys monachus]MDQ0394558.1 hypothetical protein [Labrys monachus]
MTGIERIRSHPFWCNPLAGPQMSVILHFPKQPNSRPQSGREGREKSAEILFFTGVRIERHGEGEQASRPQRRGSTGGKRRGKA